jgi:3'(2'), 5'-bisphosphate nucleotidase
VVSEEGWIPTPAEQGSLERFWLVDPLDGTKEFVSRNGEFTVNIALIENAEPVLGVVCAPAVHLLYSAAIGQGAWKDDGRGAPVRLASAPRAPGEALTVVESRSHPSPELEDWLRGVRVRRRVAAGSSLKLCWVADGTADAYPRFGPTMEWDVAAGDCVFRWSGRHGPRQSPLRYNKPGLRNGPFILGLDQVDNRVQ